MTPPFSSVLPVPAAQSAPEYTQAFIARQPVFDPTPLDQLVYRQSGNTVVWNFSLQLLHTEAQP